MSCALPTTNLRTYQGWVLVSRYVTELCSITLIAKEFLYTSSWPITRLSNFSSRQFLALIDPTSTVLPFNRIEPDHAHSVISYYARPPNEGTLDKSVFPFLTRIERQSPTTPLSVPTLKPHLIST